MILRRFASLLAVVLLVGACIYDYVPPVPEGRGFLVINGDILIGEVTEVRISRATEIGAKMSGGVTVDAVYVEGSDGSVFEGSLVKNKTYEVDTRLADPSLEYRLVVEADKAVYESEWSPVLQASPIDSISYTLSEDNRTMSINVSTHSESDERYYRWLAHQTWEYHVIDNALYFFVPAGGLLDGVPVPVDTVVPYGDRVNLYRCWNSARISNLLIASSEQMAENRLVCHNLFNIDCHDQRTQDLYSVDVWQESISGEAYRFFETIRKNSTDVGGLFSPQPSESRGNIRCRTDEDEFVLGYISVTKPSRMRRFIQMDSFQFHQLGDWERGGWDRIFTRSEWAKYHASGYRVTLPVEGDYEQNLNAYHWNYLRCVECTYWGGTKNRPDWWPNDHR